MAERWFTLLAALLLAPAAAAQEQESPWQAFQRKLQLDVVARPAYRYLQTLERARRLPGDRRLEPLDRIRVEVRATAGGNSYYWPGSGRLLGHSLTEALGEQVSEFGALVLGAHSLIAAGEGSFQPAGEAGLEGRRALRFDYQVPPEQSGFTMIVNGQPVRLEYGGSVWLDADSLELLRIEAGAGGSTHELELSSMHESMDFQPVQLGPARFTLPASGALLIEDVYGGARRSRVRFENYSLIGTGGGAPETAEDETGKRVELPPGLQLRVKLQELIEWGTAAVGDAVKARLVKDAKHEKTVYAPKGAAVRGRIVHLKRRTQPKIMYSLGLEFYEMDLPGGRAEFRARVASAGPFHGLIEPGRDRIQAREPRGPVAAISFQPGLTYWDQVRLKVRKGLPLTLRIEPPEDSRR